MTIATRISPTEARECESPSATADISSVRAEGQDRPLKILHVFDHSLPMMSGYSIRSLNIIQEQRTRGWRTVHLTSPKHVAPGPAVEYAYGFEFRRSAPIRGALQRIPYLREFAFMWRLAKEIENLARAEDPNLIHAHSPALNGMAALWAGRRLKIPVAYEVRAFWEDAAVDHGTTTEGSLRYRLTRALETYVLHHCNAIATICEGLRDDLAKRGIPAEKISLIPNGVRIQDFPHPEAGNGDAKAILGLQGETVFGFVGSFYAYEGLDLLLSALPAVLRHQPKTVAMLVGSGPVENVLRQQADRLGLADRVRFVGRVPHDQVRQYYSAIDVFVYPRHRMRLTDTVTPLKPLEAMAQRGIVLASDVGGHRELISDRETGYLFPADDANALADAMINAMSGRKAWSTLGQSARTFVERHRTWRTTTAGYADMYARAMAVHP